LATNATVELVHVLRFSQTKILLFILECKKKSQKREVEEKSEEINILKES